MLKPEFKEKSLLEDTKGKDRPQKNHPGRILARVRLDYQGKSKRSRFLFGGKNTEEAAAETRQQQAALWKNIPLQGVSIEDVEMGETYTVYDDEAEYEMTFAPMEMDVRADTLEDLVRFVVREEFRLLKLQDPETISISSNEMERVFFQIHEQVRTQAVLNGRKYND